MDTTLLLTKLLAPILILGGLGMLINPKFCEKALDDLGENAAIMRVFGVLATLGGTAIVLHHNLWEGGANVVIVTILGWSALVKGALAFLAPDALIGIASKCKGTFTIGGVIVTVIGGYLGYLGYLV